MKFAKLPQSEGDDHGKKKILL